MNAKEIAAALTGIEYPARVPKEIEAAARDAGLVIVFGASDDLMEFRGAIHDEVGAYEGTTVHVDTAGLIPEFEDIDIQGRDAKGRLRDYFKRENGGQEIRALWDTDGWTYKTAIPHETFEVIEEGGLYCRGIVFALADAHV